MLSVNSNTTTAVLLLRQRTDKTSSKCQRLHVCIGSHMFVIFIGYDKNVCLHF